MHSLYLMFIYDIHIFTSNGACELPQIDFSRNIYVKDQTLLEAERLGIQILKQSAAIL
jgi:hypothetical protein